MNNRTSSVCNSAKNGRSDLKFCGNIATVHMRLCFHFVLLLHVYSFSIVHSVVQTKFDDEVVNLDDESDGGTECDSVRDNAIVGAGVTSKDCAEVAADLAFNRRFYSDSDCERDDHKLFRISNNTLDHDSYDDDDPCATDGFVENRPTGSKNMSRYEHTWPSWFEQWITMSYIHTIILYASPPSVLHNLKTL